jgi:phosphatidylglycerophosphate synthase
VRSDAGVSESVDSAVVLATSRQAAVPIAGVPVAVRAILALREGGFGDVALLAPGRPGWAADALARRHLPIRSVESPADLAPPASSGAAGGTAGLTLLLAGDLLLDAAAARALRDARPGPVWTAEGRRVGMVCPASDVPAVAQSFALAAVVDAADSREPVPAGTRISAGLAVPVEARGSAAQLEGLLVARLGRGVVGDSYLATLIDRPLSRPLTRLFLRTPLAPAHVTLLSVAIGLLGAAGLATVSYSARLVGALLLVASIVLDCVDGDLARLRLAQSAAGARLDVAGDYLVHLAVFLGLAIGLWRAGLPPGGLWAVLALIAGVVAAMVTVHALFIRPALRQGGDLHWAGDAGSLRGRPGAVIAEKLASRDYTYLLVALAAVGRLDWFLYAAAGGAWVFTVALIAYGLVTAARPPPEAVPR